MAENITLETCLVGRHIVKINYLLYRLYIGEQRSEIHSVNYLWLDQMTNVMREIQMDSLSFCVLIGEGLLN